MKRVSIVFACVAVVFAGLWITGALRPLYDPGARYAVPSLERRPAGQVHWGEGQYIEYVVGDLPLILSAPHGGTGTPVEIADRKKGYTVGDSNTQELTRLVAQALTDMTGYSPHVIISRLSRKKLDANRELDEAAEGDKIAEKAWLDYHGFIDAAKQEVTASWGAGLYLDVHGHGHRTPWIELGYLIGPNTLNGSDSKLNSIRRYSLRTLTNHSVMPLSEVVRGRKSLGGLLESRGYRAVPAPGDPGPGQASYFSGGYSTFRHGSYFDGPISAIQIEHPKQGVRDNVADQQVYARHLAEALIEYMKIHYGFDLRVSSANQIK